VAGCWAALGFASFFLFLGFGYFDPFHAFVTVVLLQLLLLGVHSRLGPTASLPPPDLHNDARWLCALWGQLLCIAQASAFVVAGLFWHLTPAFAGLPIFLTGLALSQPYLCRSTPALAAEWEERLASRG